MATRVSRGTALGAAATLVGGAGSTLLLALSASPAGAAATWTVDTLADGAATASDCTTPVAGSCSLRDALAAAAAGDSIRFAPSLFTGGAGTITLTDGQLIDDGVDIVGPGANLLTVDAAGGSRVFQITPQAAGSIISGVTITGGSDVGGGILVTSLNTLTVRDAVVTGNHAGTFAGGIYAANLVVTGSTVSNNTSTYIGGGMIATTQLTVSNSTISGNSATQFGGGIAIVGVGTVSVLIVDSTISGNTSVAGGGIGGYFDTGTVTIANSTFTGNTVSGQGGAIGLSGPNLDISMSTITGNTASGTDPFYSGGGISISVGGGLPTVTLDGTVVAGNLAGTGGTSDIVVGGDISETGTVNATHSLLGSGVSPNVTLAGAGLLRNDAPLLGPLADNGGPTLTMLPQAGSPLLDAGPATIPLFPANEFDQRGPGFLRISGRMSDIGAVEVQVPPEPVVPAFTG